MTDDISTSGPLNAAFLSADEVQTFYEPLSSRGFNQLVKVKRQGRWFLLKGLKEEFRHKPVYLELLKKEYALMVQLDHPNIVKAIAKEENEMMGPCIVMEYIDGVTFDAFLEGNPTKEVRRKVVDQLMDALAYIHSMQILHRDLKPSNILVTRNGNNVKIIDFGLSDADDYAILKQSAGTLKYMAPEQMEPGRKIDCRADMYAFGLMLGNLFPHRYRHIAAQCTRKEPEKRYADMEAVRKAMVSNDQWRRTAPWLAVAAVLIPLLILAIKPASNIEAPETMASGMTADQKNYLGEAEWYVNTAFQPISNDAMQGEEYREVMLARLANVVIPDSVTEIGSGAFDECTSLTEVHLPASLRKLGLAFDDGPYEGRDIYVHFTDPAQCQVEMLDDESTGWPANWNDRLFVPKGSCQAFEKAEPWCGFETIQEFK